MPHRAIGLGLALVALAAGAQGVAADPYAALGQLAQSHHVRPGDAAATRALADALMDIGAVTASAQTLGADADLGVRSRLAAQRLRWAIELPPRSPDPARRFEGIDPVLAALDALLVEARAALPPDTGLLLRLQRDRAVALLHRERWQAVVEQTDALRAQGDLPLPLYVQQAEAQARLALRQPAAARALYDELLARLTPAERAGAPATVRELLHGRFQAEAEAEDFSAAFATAEALAAADPQPFRPEGPRQTPTENTHWLDAQVLAARALSYADMPVQAAQRIAPLQRDAPALPHLLVTAAEIDAQLGLPRRAEAGIETARSLAPDDFGIRLAQVDSDVRRHRLARADERLAPLLGPGEGLPQLARVRSELAAQAGPRVQVDMSGRNQNGEAARAPTSGVDWGLRVESAAFQGLWRLVGFATRGEGTLDDEDITRNLTGAGVTAHWPDLSLQGLAWTQRGTLATQGASLSGAWEPDDHWTLRAAAERHSAASPLRADLAGVTADFASLGLRHAWHASADIEAEAQRMRFSDGNQRSAGVVLGTLGLLDRPHLDLTLRPRIDWQANTRDDTSYFSPSRAWGATLAAEAKHVVWRAYECVWIQRAVLTAGSFDQSGFGGRAVGGVLYEHIWRRDPELELNYGVEWTSNVYDGDRETAWRGYLTLQYRFGR
ncbi:MAG TPA: hypothetical protein VFL64_05435 [Rhizobacter sp.]|nr:hypothetical protein [Rhizobacter sp.]